MSLEETKLDLAELQRLLNSTSRPRVRDCLVREIDQLQKEAHNLASKDSTQKKAPSSSSTNGVSAAPSSHQGYQENITNYAWDQSDKFMKLYLSLTDLASISDDSVKADYSDRSVTVKVTFANKTSQLHIARLCEPIIPESCYCKKKSDYVLVMLRKSEVGKTWPYVTEREKKSKQKDKPKMGDEDDPSAGITNLLKNMYDEGDDEMKRSISKAFYESQMKQQAGGDSLGGGAGLGL